MSHKDYDKGYPANVMCEECGWFGAEFTNTVIRSHKNRLNDPVHGPFCRKHYTEGRCDVCGKDGVVATPWAYGFPRMTTYLWGPDFSKGNA